MKNLIQIAGIMDREEAELLLDCGVDRLGFPLRIPSHDEDLTEDAAAGIIHDCKLRSRAVLITYLNHARDITDLCRRLGTSIVQIHGDILLNELRQLKIMAPEIALIKSLIVRPDHIADLAADADKFEEYVDGFIVDTYDPATGACGATGKTHDWKTSRALVDQSNKPVMLAGGLNAQNVRRAIIEVKPGGVDAHTGVEDAHGRKNLSLVEAFVAEAREAFAAL
jgi:phosphoribosylanthranilate isomerase